MTLGNTQRKSEIPWLTPRDTKLRSVCVIREDPMAFSGSKQMPTTGHPFSCGGNNKPRAVITSRDLAASSS